MFFSLYTFTPKLYPTLKDVSEQNPKAFECVVTGTYKPHCVITVTQQPHFKTGSEKETPPFKVTALSWVHIIQCVKCLFFCASQKTSITTCVWLPVINEKLCEIDQIVYAHYIKGASKVH